MRFARLNLRSFATSALLLACVLFVSVGPAWTAPEVEGLLRVHPTNPRYLTNDTGEALVLGGSHSWATFQDYAGDRPFPYSDWLDDLELWGHNFFRGWTWEDGLYSPAAFVKKNGRFNLNRFNPAFVDRLETRLQAAQDRGIYVSVMLFQGWSVSNKNGLRAPGPWAEHPFREGNENLGLGLGSGEGESTHTLLDSRVTERQKAYVRLLVRKLNHFDNLFWEISNESHDGSVAWQYEMIDFIREVESELPKQHLVWMSCAAYGGATASVNTVLFEGPAEVVSPCRGRGDRYVYNPPAAEGGKVILADTDHLKPASVTVEQVWRSFMRGMHPVFMDWYTPLTWWTSNRLAEKRIPAIRSAVGTMLRLAALEDLATMAPQSESVSFPVSSRYALFSTRDVSAAEATFDRTSLLGYLPPGDADLIVCDLIAGESYDFVWYEAVDGQAKSAGSVSLKEPCVLMKAPIEAPHGMVLHMSNSGSASAAGISAGSGAGSGALGPRGTTGRASGGGNPNSAYDWTGRDDNPGSTIRPRRVIRLTVLELLVVQ